MVFTLWSPLISFYIRCLCARCASAFAGRAVHTVGNTRFCPDCMCKGRCEGPLPLTTEFVTQNGGSYCYKCVCGKCRNVFNKVSIVNELSLRYCVVLYYFVLSCRVLVFVYLSFVRVCAEVCIACVCARVCMICDMWVCMCTLCIITNTSRLLICFGCCLFMFSSLLY